MDRTDTARRWGRRSTDHRELIAVLAVLCGFFGLVGFTFSGLRDVSFALAGTALLLLVLIYYLFPDRTVSVPVTESAYDSYARTGEKLLSEYGLQDTLVYVPTGTADDESPDVRLYVPKSTTGSIPERRALRSDLVLESDDGIRGLSFVPIGSGLYASCDRVLDDSLDDSSDAYAHQLADVLTDGFELVERAAPVSNAAPGGNVVLTIEVRTPLFGPATRFDHPVPSLVATGLAIESDQPIVVEVTSTDSSRSEYLLTFSRRSGDPDE